MEARELSRRGRLQLAALNCSASPCRGPRLVAGPAAADALDSSSVKDACVVDDDCNPGHVCMAGTCGVPGAPTADAGPEAGPLDASAEDTDDAPPPPPPFCANAPKTPPLVVCSDFDEKANACADETTSSMT